MNKVVKGIGKIAILVIILFLVWFWASYADILSKNLSPNPVYHSWNMITMAMELSGK